MVFEFILCSLALIAYCEGLTLFDSHHRDKKYIEIMVDPRLIGLLHATDTALPGVIFNYFRFGGYTGNEKKHARSSLVYKQSRESAYQKNYSGVPVLRQERHRPRCRSRRWKRCRCRKERRHRLP